MSNYARSLLDGLHKANGTYVTDEEDAAGTFKFGSNSGELPPGTGTLFQKRDNQ
jgi:hypothetical protein